LGSKHAGFQTEKSDIRESYTISGSNRQDVLDIAACVDILRDCGRLIQGGGIQLIMLGNVPDGRNAAELERYLREHGA
jgi:hypothetical protein